MATVCGTSLSLMDAGVPIKEPVAGIAMGLIKEGEKLEHGSLEGPENGVYVRGKCESNVIELPDYWTGLVDEDTITVQITPVGGWQQIYVEKIEDNKPEKIRREVILPGLLVGVTGRLLIYPEEMYNDAQSKLKNIFIKAAKISLSSEVDNKTLNRRILE